MIKRIIYSNDSPENTLAEIESALALAGPGSLERADALAIKVGMLSVTDSFEAAISTAQEALNVAQIADDARALSDTHNNLGCVLLQVGKPQGMEHLQRARDVAVRAHEWSALLRYYVNFTDFLIGCGRFAECVAMAREGRAAAVERGRSRTFGAVLTINEAEAQLGRGLGRHPRHHRAGPADGAAARRSQRSGPAARHRPGAPRCGPGRTRLNRTLGRRSWSVR